MKVFVAVLLVIGSVAARGSGPYLPSGWKPDGPAFYLPSEVAKPVPRTAQEPIVEETQASGSDALREYGPPRLEVSLDVNQGLPDVATEQTFLRAVNDEVVSAAQEAEAKTEQVIATLREVSTATESQTEKAVNQAEDEGTTLADVQTTAESLVSDVAEQKEESSDIVQSKELKEGEETVIPAVVIPDDIVPTVLVEEVVVPLSQQELVQDAVPTLTSGLAGQEIVPEAIPTSLSGAAVNLLAQEAVPTAAEEAVAEKVADGVNNIADAIFNLEKEVKAIEVQAKENAAEITSTQINSGSLEQAPEGFLEYGPPGFLEYGPPRQEVLERIVAEVSSASALDNNEVRRRRYSPKFRSAKKL